MTVRRAAAGFAQAAATLHPAYFAMVMATGIVAIAAFLQGMGFIAYGLFWFNLLVFALLALLTAVRVTRFPAAVRADLGDFQRGPGFFCAVAATCVVGSQMVLLVDRPRVATALWLAGIVLWLAVTYTVITALSIKIAKPPAATGIHAGWLLAVVATQSVALLTGLLAGRLGLPAPAYFFTLVMWLWGGMLYIWMISLIFYRYTFLVFSPADLTPPYWINMGAMAISTVAGTVLIANSAQWDPLAGLLPFVTGLTLLFWATGTWWIPMLVILGVWRHLVRRVALIYDPLYWGAVFPLGMYAVASHHLAGVIGLDALHRVGRIFTYVALLGWSVVFLALLRHLAYWPNRSADGRPRGETTL